MDDAAPLIDRQVTGATAVVLAGGRSSRMGTPKALLPFDDQPLIVHIVAALQRLFAEIVVVASPGQELPTMPVTLVRDEVAFQGPVGGIYYGLTAAGGDVSFVTSCDSAFLHSPLISHLVSQISQHDVVVPHWEGRFQPMHAVYRKTVVPFLEGQLARGELRPVYLFDKVRTRRIDEEEVQRFDPEGSSFFNMNTPEDYAEALKRWGDAGRRLAPARTGSVRCTVELFGVARLIAKTREVPLALPTEATLAQVYAELAGKLPMLVGRVIGHDGRSLLNGYACNVNGLDFVRDPTVTVNPGDNIAILSADAGG
jgi:molybdopterin-guanine dinucleotide biosynthesis protein A/molybdopterin converting factor small subunit